MGEKIFDGDEFRASLGDDLDKSSIELAQAAREQYPSARANHPGIEEAGAPCRYLKKPVSGLAQAWIHSEDAHPRSV